LFYPCVAVLFDSSYHKSYAVKLTPSLDAESSSPCQQISFIFFMVSEFSLPCSQNPRTKHILSHISTVRIIPDGKLNIDCSSYILHGRVIKKKKSKFALVQATEVHRRNRSIAPAVLNFVTRWRSVFNNTLRPLYPRENNSGAH
jgi:hypothetical protein